LNGSTVQMSALMTI